MLSLLVSSGCTNVHAPRGSEACTERLHTDIYICTYGPTHIYTSVLIWPNVLEISIPYNFYIISSLFAISSNNFISFYLSLELQSLSWISLNYLITFVLTSGRPSPTLIEAGIKNFWLSIVFSYGIWIGISLSYCFTGQTDISKALIP